MKTGDSKKQKKKRKATPVSLCGQIQMQMWKTQADLILLRLALLCFLQTEGMG